MMDKPPRSLENHIVKDLSLKATWLTLFLTTLLAMIDVRAEQKMDNSPEKQELADAQRKKEKKQKKNTGRRTEREFMKQLATGEPTAAQFAEYLKGNASRIVGHILQLFDLNTQFEEAASLIGALTLQEKQEKGCTKQALFLPIEQHALQNRTLLW